MLSTLSKICSAAMICLSLTTQADNTVLQEAKDLQSLALQNPNEVIVLMVSQDHCAFCVSVKEDFLKPLIKTQNAPPVRVINLSAGQPIIDFKGQARNADSLARELGGRFTPTLLFVNGLGETMSKKIVGLNTPEYYGFYIDKAIEEARSRLQ